MKSRLQNDTDRALEIIMKNTDPELTPTAAAAKACENNPELAQQLETEKAARYATRPAPAIDRREMMLGGNPLIEPDHKAMIERLRATAACSTLHEQVTIDEADLRQLLAFADKVIFG